jgi:hypothetical protein
MRQVTPTALFTPNQLRKRRRKKSDKENLKKNCSLEADGSQGEGVRGHCSRGHGVVALVEHHEGHLEGEIDEGGEEQLSGRRGVPPRVELVSHPQQIPDDQTPHGEMSEPSIPYAFLGNGCYRSNYPLQSVESMA